MAVTLRPSIPVQQSTGQASHSIVVKGLTRPMFTLCWHVNRGYELVNGRLAHDDFDVTIRCVDAPLVGKPGTDTDFRTILQHPSCVGV